jgi:hypothetical protein
MTVSFLGPEAEWARAEIQLDDVHGLWGGQIDSHFEAMHKTLQAIADNAARSTEGVSTV